MHLLEKQGHIEGHVVDLAARGQHNGDADHRHHDVAGASASVEVVVLEADGQQAAVHGRQVGGHIDRRAIRLDAVPGHRADDDGGARLLHHLKDGNAVLREDGRLHPEGRVEVQLETEE